jgi:hypothetical protein
MKALSGAMEAEYSIEREGSSVDPGVVEEDLVPDIFTVHIILVLRTTHAEMYDRKSRKKPPKKFRRELMGSYSHSCPCQKQFVNS